MKVKTCIYCNDGITEDSVLDVCQSCGIKVWGDKMFHAIVSNMENARADGTLCHSS